MAAAAPDREEQGTWFLGAARDRLVLIAAVVGIVVGIAVLYSILAENAYEARAELLVTPLPDELQKVSVFSAGVATSSPDPAIARTVIEFLASPAAAARNGSRRCAPAP